MSCGRCGTRSEPASGGCLLLTAYCLLRSAYCLLPCAYCLLGWAGVMPQSPYRSGGFTPPFLGWRGKPAATFEIETEALRAG